ncbi:TATA box-binding protein-associated factor RNA polymerase I subunit D [Rissa tridactyla]|uniref:TATA box-binding protein-associated factor RNA polymerase I subunit D n=1 Tax=Rissa tridactyla TaxID=75485 RepID=UPI0023BA606D|nr:TATA box-binding protein-associated factor RNA polymerase I subunit D [Rissa tridactyla]XP_054047803.1 TATA box-binding protein-associated factor RNA polymerase I subunit D [Rissa tridactyla]XP_054047810.1 TATA box-binding protein-associated factor RNA polymerase I subunit D [Rissa tridactyla]
MTDTDESQASDTDYPELICSRQKEPYKVHACETNKQLECSRSRQKNVAPEESSDELNSICNSSAEVLLDSSDSESDVSAAVGNEYHPKCSIGASEEKRRSQSSKQRADESAAAMPDNESSSDSSLSPPSPVKASETSTKQKSKFNLKAIFAYHFRGKKFKAAAHRKYKCGSSKNKKRYESTQMPTGRPPLTASPQEQKRRLLHRGFHFPFVEKHYGKKHIPLKMVLGYEQAAAKGYFQYIEMLKYEEHLRKALKALQANEDLERECLAVRKHKYLDDEGPISPIQEMNHDDDGLNSDNPEDFDARVVENSSFIISSKMPSKKKIKARKKSCKIN